jgi:sigma-E factor negative regulatory protein RseA
LLEQGVDRQDDRPLAQLSVPPSQVVPVALVTADGASALMIRDPQLDALLAAHRQMGGTTALQMPSGFLRNATFEEGKR